MFHAKSQRWMTRAALFTVLVLGLVAWSPGITSTQVQLSQKKEPSPPAELKSPIISMMAASSIDAKGPPGTRHLMTATRSYSSTRFRSRVTIRPSPFARMQAGLSNLEHTK